MPFCPTCKSLPLRDIFKFRTDSYPKPERFEYFEPPERAFGYGAPEIRPFIKWHKNITKLQSTSDICRFCSVVVGRLQDSWHYNSNVGTGDARRLWLGIGLIWTGFKVYLGDEKPEVLISGKYCFNAIRDSPIAEFVGTYDVIKKPLHPMVLATLEDWLKSCNDTHSACPRANSREMTLPSRLLDLGTLPGKLELSSISGDPHTLLEGTSLKLVENSAGSKGQYISLSYCWGTSLAYKTTSENLHVHKQDGGIQYAHLPKTLKDAVFLVRRLGLRYLWADCLCIIQDSRSDWEQEAARMADVYANAYLTIAATRASHCGEGFLQARIAKDQQIFEFADDEGSVELNASYDDLIIAPGSMDAVIDDELDMRKDGPLLGRVWCYQERVLATRTVHYAAERMVWECTECMSLEESTTQKSTEFILKNIADGLKSATDIEIDSSKTQGVPDVRLAWYRTIEGYTSRNMSFQSDKLPALSGIISALQKYTGDVCYAGIWRSWFLKGLLWRLQVPEHDDYVFNPKIPERVGKWRAPSWSFASLEGVVLYLLVERTPDTGFCATLEECSVTPQGLNPLGELASGFARIRGPITSLGNVASQVSSTGRACVIQLVDEEIAQGSMYFDIDVYEGCDVLMLTPNTGLAIIPVERRDQTYVRVGVVSLYTRGSTPYDPVQSFFTKRGRDFAAADYPEPSCITLF